MQGPAGLSMQVSAGPGTARGCPVGIVADLLLIGSGSLVTWVGALAWWRRQTDGLTDELQRDRDVLLAQVRRLQDVAARARIQSAQVTRASAEWSAGYRQGSTDMIKAMAALRSGSAHRDRPANAK
jgi:hypothetical protein